jgi:hypothetical protein
LRAFLFLYLSEDTQLNSGLLHDGGSDDLFLLVKTTGKKLWHFRYLHPATTSSRTMVSIGAYPALPLVDSRQIRAEKLTTRAIGIDPQAKGAE